MTITPDAPRPITTPPDELVEALKGGVLDHMAQIVAAAENLSGPLSPAAQAEYDQHTQGSVNFLRTRFPHVDDLTLAMFTAYIATNMAVLVAHGDLCPDSLAFARAMAEEAQILAWSVTTPDGEGHE